MERGALPKMLGEDPKSLGTKRPGGTWQENSDAGNAIAYIMKRG
jgi:hypothetical protein